MTKCRSQQKEALSDYLLGKFADEIVATASSRPQQVPALGGSGLSQDLDLLVSEHGNSLHDLAGKTRSRGGGAGLQKVVIRDQRADLRPIALAQVQGRSDHSLPHEESSARER